MSNHYREDRAPFDADLPWDDDAPAPSSRFVGQLRATLRQEAQQRMNTQREATLPPLPPVTAQGPRRRQLTPRTSHPVLGRIATAFVIAVVLIVSATGVRQWTSPDKRTPIPAAFATETSFESTPGVGILTTSGDPARTNNQPGPGLRTAPQLLQRADIAGDSMALVDNVLVVVGPTEMTALDAVTLTTLWSADIRLGAISTPVIADGQIYLTVARNTETAGSKAEDNQLIAFSLADGHEIWRADGAGAVPAQPIVSGDTIYSLGVADGLYRIGAYRVADGTAIWQTELGPSVGCCGIVGIALSDGLIAVSSVTAVSVYDANFGDRLWSKAQDGGGPYRGAPMIVGDRLIVSSGDLEIEGAPPTIGSISAYDLRSGTIVWTNESARTYVTPLTVSGNALIYSGRWLDQEKDQLVHLAVDSGDVVWSVPMPEVESDVQQYGWLLGDLGPVIVGDSAYVVVSTPPNSAGGAATSSLIAAIDLETGATTWTAQIDGMVQQSPIIVGGHIFAVTLDAGLFVLADGEEGATNATPASSATPGPGTTVDLRVPTTCTAPSATSPLLGTLPATPSIPGVAEWKEPINPSQIPSGGTSVDSHVAEELARRFREYRSCSDLDPYTKVFGFFSTDFYVRLLAMDEWKYNTKAEPWAIWIADMGVFLSLDTHSVQMLPDGRIGSLIHSPVMNFYVWWVQEDGVWKIDEYHWIGEKQIDPDATTPPPSLNPEGTPYG